MRIERNVMGVINSVSLHHKDEKGFHYVTDPVIIKPSQLRTWLVLAKKSIYGVENKIAFIKFG